jgi:hypothetical protein
VITPLTKVSDFESSGFKLYGHKIKIKVRKKTRTIGKSNKKNAMVVEDKKHCKSNKTNTYTVNNRQLKIAVN